MIFVNVVIIEEVLCFKIDLVEEMEVEENEKREIEKQDFYVLVILVE